MKLLLVILMAGVLCFEFCHCSYWDHKPGMGPQRVRERMSRDRPRPLRHHRHIQAHNSYHRPPSRMHRPIPPPGHRRRSRPPPHHHRNAPGKSFMRHMAPVVKNEGSMFIQPMGHTQQSSGHPPRRYEGPPQFFQQDEIIHEQSKHFPITTVPNQQTSPNYQSVTESQPHGYLSSTYKGWKPIVKPYQNSYVRGPKLNNNKGGDYPRKQEFEAGHPNSLHQGHPGQSNNMHQQHLSFNTLFREHTDHMKNGVPLKSEYSENQAVSIPLPTGGQIRVPQSLFRETHSPWNNPFNGVMTTQQSEEVPVVKKPNFNKFKTIVKSSPPLPPTHPPLANENPNGGGSKLTKFKFRPRPRPGNPQETNGQSKLPPFTQQSDEVSNSQNQPPLNLKGKFNNRGRVRIRKVIKPFVQSEEEGLPVPKPLQPFESTRSQSSVENSNIDNSGDRQPGPSYPPRGRVSLNRPNIENQIEERPRRPSHSPPPPPPPPPPSPSPSPPPPHRNNRVINGNRAVNNIRNHTDETFSSPHNGGDHRISHPPSNFYQRPESQYIANLPETTEPEAKHNIGVESQQQGERRKRPKANNKNKAIEHHQEQEQQQQPAVNNEGPAFLDDFYFPPGFSADPTKNTGQHPVSFMTMPGSKPQVIHHTYNSQRQQTQQQLYPINVIRSPASDLEYQRPNQGHSTNSNPNYRPRYVVMNAQNGASQPHRENSGFHNPTAAYPSNHESTYTPHAFGSNISPFTYGSPYPPSRHPMTYLSSSPAVPQYEPPRASSTTMRNPYFHNSNAPTFSVPYEGSPTVTSYEIRDYPDASPYPSSHGYIPTTSPSSYVVTSPRSTMHPPTHHHPYQKSHVQPTQSYPDYTPGYGSGEYDKIPMQFMDQLRPILRDEPMESPSTTPHGSHAYSHQSSDIHPPAGFFDDFFKPFDDSYNPSPDQDLDTKASSPVQNQIRGPNTDMGYDTYKAQSSPQVHVVPRPVSNSYGTSTTAHSTFSRSPQIYESSPASVTSSTQKVAYNDVNSHPQKSWSKLREEEVEVSSTEMVPHSTTPVQKKITSKVNQSKQQSSLMLQSQTTKTKSRDSYHGIDQDQKRISATTYKPSDPIRLRNVDGNLANEESNPPDHHVSDVESISPHDDDFNDSNTPRSVRVRGREPTQSVTQRVTTELPEDSEIPTTFKSRRQFRRRRPESGVRRRYFSSRVKRPIDLDEEKEESSTTVKSYHQSERRHLIHMHKESFSNNEKDDEYEPSRVSGLKHRRLFNRRRNLAAASNRLKGAEEKPVSTSTMASPPSSTEAESVTYGESQWFRIKPTESSEQEGFHGANKQGSGVSSTSSSSHPKISTLKPVAVEKDHYKSKVGSTMSGVELQPLESTTEVSAEEVIKPSYSSKHSISFKEERRFPSHKSVIRQNK